MRVLCCAPEFWVIYSKSYMDSKASQSYNTQEVPGDLVKTQVQLNRCGWVWDSISTSFQAMLMLLEHTLRSMGVWEDTGHQVA